MMYRLAHRLAQKNKILSLKFEPVCTKKTPPNYSAYKQPR